MLKKIEVGSLWCIRRRTEGKVWSGEGKKEIGWYDVGLTEKSTSLCSSNKVKSRVWTSNEIDLIRRREDGPEEFRLKKPPSTSVSQRSVFIGWRVCDILLGVDWSN